MKRIEPTGTSSADLTITYVIMGAGEEVQNQNHSAKVKRELGSHYQFLWGMLQSVQGNYEC
jgi:hypothetical protein